jgi:drug/metabolite transporter (DMT)-like permease
MSLDRPQAQSLSPPAADQVLLPVFAVIAGAVAMGISPIFVRLADVGPFASAFWRVALALPLLWAWMRWDTGSATGDVTLTPGGRALAPIVIAGALFAGDLVFWHLAIMKTTVANATFFATMAPLVTALAAAVILRERMARTTMAGFALCAAGATLILGSSLRIDHDRLVGDGLGIVTAMFFGLYMVAVKLARRRVPTSALMFWSTLVTALILLAVAAVAEPRLLPASAGGLVILLSLAIVSHIGGQGLLAYALGHLPATFSSLVIFLEAVAAAALGYMVLGEHITLFQVLGGIAIVSGIYVARPRNRRPTAPVAATT